MLAKTTHLFLTAANFNGEPPQATHLLVLNTFFAMVLNFTGAFFGGTASMFTKQLLRHKGTKGCRVGQWGGTEDDEEDGKPAGIRAGICTPSAVSSSAVRLGATGGHALAAGGFTRR